MILTKFPDCYSTVKKSDVVFNSDHEVLHFYININVSHYQQLACWVYDFKHADIALLKTHLRDPCLNEVVSCDKGINEALNTWLVHVRGVIDSCVPRI